jgi:hypothetical protein
VQGVSLILHRDQKCAVLGITWLRLCDLKASLGDLFAVFLPSRVLSTSCRCGCG